METIRLSDAFRLPVERDRLFGTDHLLPATMVPEYVPIIDGSLLKRYQECTPHNPVDVSTIEWEIYEPFFPENYYTARIKYRTEEWNTSEEGNIFFYNLNVEKMFDLPLGVKITTVVSELKIGKKSSVLLPRETVIQLTGDEDTLMLYRLSF